ncbi:MAG: DegT/DnrJ/EryC1/StrS family aminotransferase, partial [Bacteroidales bacterium]
TAEGGALISRSRESKEEVDLLKNFGFAGETTVLAPGINAKMDEIRAALGLLNLTIVDEAIAKRKVATELYRNELEGVEGITFLKDIAGVKHNYSYFPIFVDERQYGMSRDALYERLKEQNIYGRRYFYPLISKFDPYRKLESSAPENIPVATEVANSVICLPMHHYLEESEVVEISQFIRRWNPLKVTKEPKRE